MPIQLDNYLFCLIRGFFLFLFSQSQVAIKLNEKPSPYG